jgi:hypothetical protein
MTVHEVDAGPGKISRSAEVNAPAVTETFDYSQLSPAKVTGLRLFGSLKHNVTGIEATLRQLQARFAGSGTAGTEH